MGTERIRAVRETAEMSEQDLTKVLNLVNRARTATGKARRSSLPKGSAHSPYLCPLALALDAFSVSTMFIQFYRGADVDAVAQALGASRAYSHAVHTPALFKRFIQDLDGGRVPQLVKEE
jgi:hypothetical protein